MINFNPLTSDLNENVYVEFIDTMGYDRGKTVNDYSGFFNQILKKVSKSFFILNIISQ